VQRAPGVTFHSAEGQANRCLVDAERRVVSLLPGGYLTGPVTLAAGWRVEGFTRSRRSSPRSEGSE
jgi:hypothetical protein